MIRLIPPILLLLAITACNNLSNDSKHDPNRPYLNEVKEWTDSLVIEGYFNGGMSPEAEHFIVRKDSVIADFNKGNINNRYAFAPSQEELNELLSKLNSFNIDELTIRKIDDIIYDAPSRGITIRLGSKFIDISNGATEEITEKKQGDFQNIYGLISRIGTKAVEGKLKKLCINLDPSIKTGKGMLSIIPEGGDDTYSDSIPNLKEQTCFVLSQGKHSFQIHITDAGKNGVTEYISSIYPAFEIQTDTTMKLFMKEGGLVLE